MPYLYIPPLVPGHPWLGAPRTFPRSRNARSGVGFGQYSSIASAIQTQEGYYPGSPSYVNNNPGNLIASSWTQSQPGYVGTDKSGFAVFDTYANGLAAENALIGNYAASGATIQSMMAAWAPASQAGNNPDLYASNVAAAAGLSPSDLVSAAADSSSGDASLFDLSSLTSGFDLTSLSGSTIAIAAGALLLLLLAVEA